AVVGPAVEGAARDRSRLPVVRRKALALPHGQGGGKNKVVVRTRPPIVRPKRLVSGERYLDLETLHLGNKDLAERRGGEVQAVLRQPDLQRRRQVLLGIPP